jgi:hypothetical protein
VRQSDTALEQLVAAMQRGEFIYREGRIYRTIYRGKSCTPRLADTAMGTGYRTVYYGDPALGIRPRNIYAHRVVWVFHNGPIPMGLEINHIDGVKSNNILANLELVTTAENMQHRHGSGIVVYALTPEVVRAIRKLYATGNYRKSQVAEMLGVTYPNVRAVLLGYSWRWLDE